MAGIIKRKGLHFERGGWAIGFYRVGLTWVALVKAPRFGMIHWGHWSPWRCLATFPRAFFAHVRLLCRGS